MSGSQMLRNLPKTSSILLGHGINPSQLYRRPTEDQVLAEVGQEWNEMVKQEENGEQLVGERWDGLS